MAWPFTTFSVSGVQHMRTATLRRTGWVSDPRYRDHVLQPGHPESPLRLETIDAYMSLSGAIDKVVPLTTIVAPQEHILRVHSQEHLDSVLSCDTTGPVACMAAGAVLGALDAVHAGVVDNAFCSIRPPGHHAFNNGADYDGGGQGQGFCFINTIAVAAKYAQSVLGYERILIVDWDYHYGNGTARAFASDPSVLFFSTHNRNDYPQSGNPSFTGKGAGKGYTINVHVPCGADDETILAAWDTQLMNRVEEFAPQFVLISAGYDSRTGDSLGCFAITDAGFAELTRRALAIADSYAGGHLVAMLEGGYTLDGLARSVVATTMTMAGLDWKGYELSSVRNRRGFVDTGEPYVCAGHLHMPELARYDMLGLAIMSPNGSNVVTLTRDQTECGRIDLRNLGLGSGAYTILFRRRSGEALMIDFTLV